MKKNVIDFIHLYFDEEGAEGGATAGGGANDAGKEPAGAPAPKDEKKYSDADLDKIIEKKLAKWQKQKAADVDEAKRLATMTAQERAEHERDKLQKELDELKRANTVAEMEKTARSILATDGVNIPDTIVSVLVGEDADATSNNVKAFAKAYKQAVQDGVKAALSHKSPAAGTGAGTLTKADILKEKDPVKRQKLIRQNMSLFR